MALSVLPRYSSFNTLCPRVLKRQLRPLVATICLSSRVRGQENDRASGARGKAEQRIELEWLTPGMSHVLSPGKEPLQNITLGQLVERAANLFGDRKALVSIYEKKTTTYSDLLIQADRFAAGLIALGLKKGDRVALWGLNSTDWLICKFGTVRAGMILVTLNPAYQPPELKYALSIVGANAVIVAPKWKSLDFPGILNRVVPEIKSSRPGEIRSEELPDLRVAIIMSDEKMEGLIGLKETQALSNESLLQEISQLQNQISPKDVCEIQYTSGTTGNPKGCMLTHHSMTNNAIIGGGFYIRDSPDDTMNVLLAIPFFHVYASVLGLLSATYYGRTTVLASPLYTIDALLHALHTEKPEMLMTAPTILMDLIHAVEGGVAPPKDLLYAITGGGMASPDLFRSMRAFMPNTFVGQGYGMTETAPVITILPLGSTQDQQEKSVGTFIPHTEAKIVNSQGHIVPIGAAGELVVRGYMTTPGYWRDEAKTAELLDKDGWLHTGDLFLIRPDGYASIIGRIKDVIVRGGENIFPREVEIAIETHPNVLEALVFGVEDKRFAEEVACVVRVREGTLTLPELKAFLKEKLSYYKIPRYLKVVTDVPRTSAGKPKKFEIRKMMEEELKKTPTTKS